MPATRGESRLARAVKDLEAIGGALHTDADGLVELSLGDYFVSCDLSGDGDHSAQIVRAIEMLHRMSESDIINSLDELDDNRYEHVFTDNERQDIEARLRSVRSTTDPDALNSLNRIARLAIASDALRVELDQEMASGQERGATFSDIARVLGITQQSVHQRMQRQRNGPTN